MEERTYLSGTSLAGMSPTRSRVENDYYATPFEATEAILSREELHGSILEPAAGEGHFESQKRFEMFREHDFEIMYLNRRVSYFKNYADQKPSLNPPFSSVYVCKGMLPKQIIFEEIQKTS